MHPFCGCLRAAPNLDPEHGLPRGFWPSFWYFASICLRTRPSVEDLIASSSAFLGYSSLFAHCGGTHQTARLLQVLLTLKLGTLGKFQLALRFGRLCCLAPRKRCKKTGYRPDGR